MKEKVFSFFSGPVMRRASVPALFFIFLCFFSCRSFNSVVLDPVLSLSSVELSDVSFNGVDLICHVDVENPNGFSLPFPKIDYELFVNSASFVKGVLDEGEPIRRRRTVTVDVPLSFTYEELYKTFSSLIESKEAAYNIALGFNFPLQLIQDKKFSLDFSGVLPLIETPRLSPGEIKIVKADFAGIELDYGVNIENPNAFAVPFPDVEWEYGVAGVPLLKSALRKSGDIAPKSTSETALRIGLSYADILKSVESLAGAGEAPSVLSLNSSFPIPALDEVKNAVDIPGTIPILCMPEISVNRISIKNLAFQRLEFIVNWEVENKNSFAMDIDEFNYDVTVNNRPWAKGLFQDPPVLKANSKTALPLTVVVDSLAAVTELVDIISSGAGVNYKCVGDMSLTSDFPGLSTLDIPVDLSGSSRLQR